MIHIVLLLALVSPGARADDSAALDVGVAGYAFDHLGAFVEQSEAAAASGANVIFATGCGAYGYTGLPPEKELLALGQAAAAYNKRSREQGIRLVFGYVCATSIVDLETFDDNWSDELRGRFKTPPAEWRQQDAAGQPLPSWYGGAYSPACMNNPDWREYECTMVRLQLESDHDGIFFDNPTVHPLGCYCPHCMKKFADLLVQEGIAASGVSVEEARRLAAKHPDHFLRFRGATARDFLQFMRDFARTVRPGAVVTCNNSLNTPDALYKQAHTHGYNIYEMTKAEDLLVVEDMVTQPRLLPGGQAVEYGPTLQQLHALGRGLPVVANVLAESDYHTPPNLVRLAMAEAAAHDASYLLWPTWPEDQRDRMAQAIRPQADVLRENAALLNDTQGRRDVILFLPFRRWTEITRCIASELAARLTAANVQYGVVTEDDLVAAATPAAGAPAGPVRTAAGAPVHRVVLVESRPVLQPAEAAALEKFESSGGLVVAADEGDWMKSLQSALQPSVALEAPATVRAVVRDQAGRTIVHLYNLAIDRRSSFEDTVHPALDVKLRVRIPAEQVQSVTAISADATPSRGTVPYTCTREAGGTVVELTVAKLNIATMLVIE